MTAIASDENYSSDNAMGEVCLKRDFVAAIDTAALRARGSNAIDGNGAHDDRACHDLLDPVREAEL